MRESGSWNAITRTATIPAQLGRRSHSVKTNCYPRQLQIVDAIRRWRITNSLSITVGVHVGRDALIRTTRTIPTTADAESASVPSGMTSKCSFVTWVPSQRSITSYTASTTMDGTHRLTANGLHHVSKPHPATGITLGMSDQTLNHHPSSYRPQNRYQCSLEHHTKHSPKPSRREIPSSSRDAPT
jgi:hypothetical protein